MNNNDVLEVNDFYREVNERNQMGEGIHKGNEVREEATIAMKCHHEDKFNLSEMLCTRDVAS